MKRDRRLGGFALGGVLALLSIVLVLGFVMAAASTFELSFAANNYRRNVAEQLARAAVTEFIYQCEGLGNGASGTHLTPLQMQAHFDGRPLVVEGTNGMPGTVEVHFATDTPYYSVDNSEDAASAAGWTDLGSGQTSVPPYTVDLMLNVTAAGNTSHFEALLQRRWQYVLASGKPVNIAGSGGPQGLASTVRGNVLIFDNSKMLAPLDQSGGGRAMWVDSHIWQNMGIRAGGLEDIAIGGMVLTMNDVVSGGVEVPVPVPSVAISGNSLTGRVDSFETDAVVAAPGNQFNGQVRAPYSLGQTELSNLDTLLYSADAVGNSGGCKLGSDQPTVCPQYGPPLTQLTVPAQGGSQPFFLITPPDLYQGCALQAGELSGSNNGLYQLPKFLLDGPCGTIFYQASNVNAKPGASCSPSPTPPPGGTASPVGTYYDAFGGGFLASGNSQSLQLQNCEADVGGDFMLWNVGISGSNAALVVDGNLVINNGTLSAPSGGMVIACKNLVLSGQGEYHGVMLVEGNVLITEGQSGASMLIRGGIVSGNMSTGLPGVPLELEQVPGPGSKPGVLPPTTQFDGVTLFGVDLEYDPTYMQTLNQFANFSLLTLRFVQ